MADAIQQVKVPFPPNASVKELLNRPELATYPMEQVTAILVSSRRLSDVMTYLHKPPSKPQAPSVLPGGSIFRGMVFGRISIYTNRGADADTATVLIHPVAAAPSAPPPPVRMTTPASAPKKAPVKMVGMPSKKAPPQAPPQAPAQSSPQAPPPAQLPPAEAAPADSAPFISDRGGAPTRRPPSREKVKRWTEIIPSGTRSRRPSYPGTEEAEVSPGAGAEDPVRALDTQPTMRVASTPPGAGPPDHLALARELDQLISDAISLTENIDQIPEEERSDLVSELNMLHMELEKFEPGIVRITEMILNISDVVETQAHVVRIKECLRELGLLL